MINRENPYYIGLDDEKILTNYFSPIQRDKMRENTMYFWNIIVKLIKSKGDTSVIAPNYRKQILSGKLLNSDNKIDNGTGEKLKALIIALDKEENRNKFCNSYFFTAARVLTTGQLDTEDKTEWSNYSKTENCENDFVNRPVLNSALLCYKRDSRNMPIGINIDRFLDTIIKKDTNGNYIVSDTNAEQGDLLAQAVLQHVNDMKNNVVFKRNFRNKVLEDLEKYEEENQ